MTCMNKALVPLTSMRLQWFRCLARWRIKTRLLRGSSHQCSNADPTSVSLHELFPFCLSTPAPSTTVCLNAGGLVMKNEIELKFWIALHSSASHDFIFHLNTALKDPGSLHTSVTCIIEVSHEIWIHFTSALSHISTAGVCRQTPNC